MIDVFLLIVDRDAFAQQRGVVDEPGQGRKTLAREAAGNYNRIRSLCPEYIARLEQRLSERT